MNPAAQAEGISRRRMLTRIGAGAAVAWTVPIVTSIATPAFAVGSVNPCESDTPCNPCCGPFLPCCKGVCFNGCDTENNCICFNDNVCNNLSPCTDSRDCLPGYRCLCPNNGCYMSVCVFCCGGPFCKTGSRNLRGRTVAGRY